MPFLFFNLYTRFAILRMFKIKYAFRVQTFPTYAGTSSIFLYSEYLNLIVLAPFCRRIKIYRMTLTPLMIFMPYLSFKLRNFHSTI